MIVPTQNSLTLLGAIDGRSGNFTQQLGQRPTVIHFIMLHHNIINLLEVDFTFQPCHKLLVKRLPNGIEQRHLLIAHKICVVT